MPAGPRSLARPVARPRRAARRARRVRRRARTSCTASTWSSPPARPTRSSAPPARASRRCCGWCCASTTPAPGQVLLRRPGRARPRLGLAARLDRLRRPGRLPVRRAPSPTTSPTAGPTPPASRSGRPPSAAAALDFIEALPDGLDAWVGERGRDPVRRPAAAARPGPRAAARPRGAGARRGDQRRRQRDRGRDPALAAPGHRAAHGDRRRPPALDRAARPPDLGPRRGPGRRVRAPTTSWSTGAGPTPPCGGSRPARHRSRTRSPGEATGSCCSS